MNKNIFKIVAVVSSAVVSSAAMADAGTDAITALGASATGYITAAFAVAVIAAGGFWGIQMMKKAFANAK